MLHSVSFALRARRALTIASVAVAVMAASAAPAGAKAASPAGADGLWFGLISVQAPEEIRAEWRPLLAALAEALGRTIQPDVAREYADVVWSMRNGRDSVAWLGNKSGIEAVDNAGGEVFARMVFEDGEAGYHSLLIARADLPLHGVDEVFAHAGQLTLGSGDPNSTSGYLVPAYQLFARNGINPRRAFRRVVHANHESNIRAVAEGRVDVATVASIHYERMVHAQPALAKAIRVIWRSPQIPSDPLVWRRDLPDGLKQQIRAFFLDYGSPGPHKTEARLAEERRVLAQLGLARFIASDDSQLLPVRQIMLFKRRLAVETDSGLDDSARLTRLRAIDDSLAQLDRTGPAE